jgi:topoisomerase IA-like protein
MKQSRIAKARKRHLAAEFENLDYKSQEYIETLTTQLAAINETTPENQQTIGKNPQTMLPIKAKIG